MCLLFICVYYVYYVTNSSQSNFNQNKAINIGNIL